MEITNILVPNKLEILTPTGFKPIDGIKTKTKAKTIIFEFENITDVIECTPEHKINYDDTLTNFKLACDFKVGDYISHKEYGFAKIKKIKRGKTRKVYDILEVKDHHIYYANGFKHHNCVFSGSNSALLSSDTIKALHDCGLDPIDKKHGQKLLIYEYPEPSSEYILGVDPAEGVGKDYSVVQVLKMTRPNPDSGDYFILEQVAVYRHNLVKVKEFAQIAIGIGKYYNEAYMMVENNNSCGGLVCYHIWNEYEYGNMVNPDWKDKRKPGINANSRSKYEANMKLRELADTRQVKIIDKQTIQELSSYEEQGTDCYAAASGSHDDTVTALLWAITFLNSTWYSGYGENFGQTIAEEYEIFTPTFINAGKMASNNRNQQQTNPYGHSFSY